MDRVKKTDTYQSVMKKVEESKKEIEDTMHREYFMRKPAPKIIYDRSVSRNKSVATVTQNR